MKIKRLVVLVLLFLATFSACDEDDPGIENTPEEEPEPTAVGIPNGIAVSQTIGSQGGSISIAGEIEIEIPSGALTADTEISIQPITNNVPNGNAKAYRLGPDGINFNKAVKLTFPYTQIVDGPQITGIAFQNDDGIWYSPGRLSWNATTHTVTAETTHFSDWATFDLLRLDCNSCEYVNLVPTLKVGETAQFEVHAISPGAIDSDEITALIPANPDNNAYDLIVKDWFVNGVKAGTPSPYGSISPTSTGCTYTAPNKVPAQGKNPVSLMVTLKNLLYEDPTTGATFNDLQLMTSINIVGDSKYELVIKFLDDTMITGGLVGAAFTVKDSASIQVLAKADGSIICSDFKNSPGVIIPTSKLDPSGNKSTCTSDTFLGPIHVTQCSGLWGTTADGKREIQFIVTGEGELPAFDWVGALGGKASFPQEKRGLMQIFFFAINDGNPTWKNTNEVMTAKLIPIE